MKYRPQDRYTEEKTFAKGRKMTTKDVSRSIYVKLLQEKVFPALFQPFAEKMLNQYGHRKIRPLHTQPHK